MRVFYDLDTPITLSRLRSGELVSYLPTYGLGDFDVVLSYTGGRALEELGTRLGARAVAPLYGSVDPDVHRPAPADPRFTCDMSYLGTYSADRQEPLDRLFLQAADCRPQSRFVLAGSQYPEGFAWKPNVYYMWHLTPAEHPSFYCSSQLTLNVTRGPMAEMGYCPSGRLFEAAACGATIVSDEWEGLDHFFEAGKEILVASTTADSLAALNLDPDEKRAIGQRARERTLDCHTATERARDLERILNRPTLFSRSDHVGYRPGGGSGKPHPTTGVFERAAAGRQPKRW
jgi:spore maturation protein CgeB